MHLTLGELESACRSTQEKLVLILNININPQLCIYKKIVKVRLDHGDTNIDK